MKEIALVTGGCRSGKSAHALALAASMAAGPRYFLATCVPGDREMQDRVARHQQDRGKEWQTIECPVAIGEAILRVSEKNNVVLVDCLTLWMNNLLAETEDQVFLEQHIDALTQALTRAAGSVILVTNEVGCGIVPADRLTRLFRDMTGLANQRVAAAADKVVWMVSGVPVIIKVA
ncbi:MAG: bifunctional adenosylcobinamide kinase/adenosylcobinamide-phosphate guanylyltransferase [Thermodesulfobacteriota bacterium]